MNRRSERYIDDEQIAANMPIRAILDRGYIMSLSHINKNELAQGFASGNYKGFSVYVESCRGGYRFSVMLMLENDSDAAHVIASKNIEPTLHDLKLAAKGFVNEYPYTSQELLTMHDSESINNLDTRTKFETDPVTGNVRQSHY
ncbi:hypothetical protein [Vibrio furnissii]|uniref:hypothetical protein n=1 Tax=Vibrio furnissii TaxID=29494 RepID=UPI001C9C9BE1|nr:hypothetical protein [Vibrio furnissii]MBY7933096.1 hypothetical protein [Vibrio fluvialis]MCG6230246.1 hypothetical protein [Vibrio furnissii]MCG6268445.1 hypothetical protein [Vibrio furnissii]